MPSGRILVVDDSPFVQRAITRMLEPLEGVEVVGYAGTGAKAVDEVQRLAPDGVIMDVNMPEMDGLQALQSIMRHHPTPVLLMSTLTRPGADVTLQGLELGAVDFIDKGSAGTSMDIFELGPVLREKVSAMLTASAPPGPASTRERGDVLSAFAYPAPVTQPNGVRVVAIGASTGGPRALTQIIPSLPADLGAAVVVAQHMPEGFTATLAERLDRRARLSVREARDGDDLVPGTVHVAPGRREMRVIRRADRLVADVRPPESRALNQPSADVLFRSAARAAGKQALGVILTGMGEDGAAGCRSVHEAGGTVIVESEETAVIYGMPRASRPFADHVLPLERIAGAITRLCESPTRPGRLG